MERCKTCKHWEPYIIEHPFSGSTDERAGGFCESEKITEDYGRGFGPDMLVYTYTEGGAFWTGPEFGCVLHEQKE
jgi:hypothetical protein